MSELNKELQLAEEELKDLEHQSFLDDSTGLRLSVQKIKMPSGGSTYFDLGDGKPVNDLTGLIIDNYDIKTCFLQPFNGEENRPDCQSKDCITGIDKEGNEHQCNSCEYGKFVKGEKSKCSTRRRIYFIPEGKDLPFLILVPPTSMRSFRQYVERLQYANQTTRTVITRMWLKAEKSNTGFPYASIQFIVQRELEGSERAEALIKAKELRPLTRFEYVPDEEEGTIMVPEFPE